MYAGWGEVCKSLVVLLLAGGERFERSSFSCIGKERCPVGGPMGNSSVTHVTFFQFFYFHQATIKHLVDQSNKFKAYDDLGVQFYITT